MSTIATHGRNDTRFDDLLVKARDLGAQAARGKDTLVQFGILVVNAAQDGVLDLIKDKHGTGVDDAVKAYQEYHTACASATIFDHKSPNGKVQSSKLRACIKLGNWTRGGPGQPVATMNKLFAMRDKLRRDPMARNGLDDAYNTLLRYARYQVKQNGPADDENLLRALCMKAPSKQATLEEYLQATVKRLDDLEKGTAQGRSLSHSSPTLMQARIAIRQELADLRRRPPETTSDDE